MRVIQKAKFIVLGMAIMFVFSAIFTPSMAAMIQKQISVSTGVNIYVDDVKLNPVDANGKSVEVFIYNGTTYLPVRVVANAVGKPVIWDGKTSSVYLGKHKSNEPTVMLHELDYFNTSEKLYGENRIITGKSYKDIFGKQYTDYISYDKTYSSAWYEYRINGQYSSLKGIIAMNYDKRTTTGIGNFRVYGDDKILYSSPSIAAGFDTTDFEVDLTGVLTLRIEFFIERAGTLTQGSSKDFAIIGASLYQ